MKRVVGFEPDPTSTPASFNENLLSLICCDYATATVFIPSSLIAHRIRSSAVTVGEWNLLDGWARRGK